MLVKFLEEKIKYTGAELRPHWISERTKSFESAMVAFAGPCDVATAELVDLEDSRVGDFIRAKEMLHFLAESFSADLELAICHQRLLVALFAEKLRTRLSASDAARVLRDGDDIFVSGEGEPRKLSVSIVTASPVSTLLHFGVNIDADGAPVKAIGLRDLGVDYKDLAMDVMESWQAEVVSMARARCKVVPR
jgi:hypothetical protein